MLIFDQLRKDDRQIRVISLLVLAGLGILLVGLWWVQIVMSRTYQLSLETQSYRSVRIPAVRGKLLDRNGVALAENRPTFNISLYLEELRKPFDSAYFKEVANARASLNAEAEELSRKLGRRLRKEEKRNFILGTKSRTALRQKARALVASNVVFEVSQLMGEPILFEPEAFERHYLARLALPFPVLKNLTPIQLAKFQEQSARIDGVDLEVQSTRVYPYRTLAAHMLGLLKRNDDSKDGEEAFFSYRLADYVGIAGMEGVHDKELRGSAGAKSVLVNNVGYRQTEKVWVPAEPGRNLVLTLDQQIQEACERALAGVHGPATRGAVVVMDVQSGDVLALASSPTLDPNHFVRGFPTGELQRVRELRAELNRATQENYAPGSIFKMVVGMAALEAGLDPDQIHTAIPNPEMPSKAIVYVGNRGVRDTAPPGPYDFKRALKLSSNSYFVTAALRTGPERIVRLGQRFHLGERTGLVPWQETPGELPSVDRVSSRWTDGNTANLSLGQDPVLVTPLQVAVMTSAIANGGRVFWPRVADRLESQYPEPGEQPLYFARAQVRDQLGVSANTLAVMRRAMLADVEDSDGTGRRAAIPGLRVCGKTGTAQVKNLQGQKTGQITWFASFAPFEAPRYAVVVMVEDGASGGETCAPVAASVYTAIRRAESQVQNPALASATR